ncbi:DUF2827 family protein [Burkholderia ubonensis]|uniref:DUF2827 family protein n=1 Tax=Burkholderia ubonensis TaxID=101571 RepID=UPI000A7048A8|nr:DUF2827 family protein [Burkholderia ubonensis]
MKEAVLFRKPLWGGYLFVNQRYDDVWIIPYVANISRAYFDVLRCIFGQVVPFVWRFVALMNQLDIGRAHWAVFLGRHEPPALLAEHTDVVVSHQLENPLSYFYLEVCRQGYPLVHNASLCSDLGYYYHDQDVEEGARRVIDVLPPHG